MNLVSLISNANNINSGTPVATYLIKRRFSVRSLVVYSGNAANEAEFALTNTILTPLESCLVGKVKYLSYYLNACPASFKQNESKHNFLISVSGRDYLLHKTFAYFFVF